jgi:glycosyltransferase involved in cell wall biosynthesis
MHGDSPLVSVIIPNYNHAPYLPQRIESVLQQTYSNIEVLILDDCSPDNSRDVIQHYAQKDKRVRTAFNTENSGSTFKQWSKGIGLTNGKYIWIAESDDYANLRFLEILVAKLEDDEAIGLAYCDSWHVYEDTQRIELNPELYEEMDITLWKHDFVLEGRTLITRFMSYANIIPNASAVVLRRSVVDQLALPDGQWKLVGDWVYWASMMAVSRVAFVSTPLNYFRFHGNNVRSAKLTNGTTLLEILTVVKIMQQYGVPNEPLFNKQLHKLMSFWFHTIISPDYHIPLHRHQAIFQGFKALDTRFTGKFLSGFYQFMFHNKLSGLRQLIGDGILYPLLKKAKQS